MLKSRPFQVLIAALIVLGMHVCCCRAVPIRVDLCGGDSLAAEAECDLCCDHECDDEPAGDDAPRVPGEPKHDCCGVHSKPLTVGPNRAELPPVTWCIVEPDYLDFAVPAPGTTLGDSRLEALVPRPETSLLRRHCALIV